MKNIDPQEPLEQFIDDTLKGLPDFKAPPQLLGKVMTRIELQPVAWWQPGWVCWPLAMQLASILVLATLAWLCLRGIGEVCSSESTSLLLAKAGHILGDAFDLFRVAHVPTPFKVYLLLCPLCLAALCLIAPVVVGGIRVVCALTLHKYED